MRRKKLFCKELYWNILRLQKIIIVAVTMIIFLGVPLMHALKKGESFLFFSYNIVLIGVTMTMPILLGLIFNYLYEEKGINALHGFPYTRPQLYVANMLAGYTVLIIPFLINGGLLLLIRVIMPETNIGMGQIIYVMASYIVMNCVLFTIGSMISMMVSSSILYVGLTYVILLVPSVVMVILTSILYPYFLVGYEANQRAYEFLYQLSPLLFAVTFFDRGQVGYWLTPALGFYYIAIGVLCYMFAITLYKKRPLEKSKEWVAFSGVHVLIRLLAAIIGSFVVGVFFMLITYAKSYEILLWLILCGAIGYVVATMFLDRSTKILKKCKVLLVYELMICLGFLGMKYDILGYQVYVPERETIKTVQLDSPVIEELKGVNPLVVREKDEVDRMIGLHERLRLNARAGVAEDSDDYQKVRISYMTEDGSVLKRYYWIPGDDLRELYEELSSFEAMRQVDLNKEKSALKGVNIMGIRGYVTVKEEDYFQLVKAINEDLGRITLDQRLGEEEVFNIRMRYGNEQCYLSINNYFINTIQWLRNKELYGEALFSIEAVKKIRVEKEGSMVEVTDQDIMLKILNNYSSERDTVRTVLVKVKTFSGEFIGYISPHILN